jgi:hypothetical protein
MAVAMNYEKVKADFQLVAREIGCSWKMLGRELNVPHPVIESIESDYIQIYEKAYQVLMKWYEENGQARATIEVLGKALLRTNKRSIAEKIGFRDFSQGNNATILIYRPS